MILNIPPRPNRLEDVKDEDYHSRYARWCIGSYNLYSHQAFVSRYLTNVAFYKGDQWIFDEDLETFLADESGEPRNRIKWIHNIIKPFVEYYRGAAIKMDLSSEVVSISRESRNRRDMALDKMLYWTKVARQMEKMGQADSAAQIREQYAVGKNEAETRELFENLYIDVYVKKMNLLKKYIAEVRNDLDSHKVKLAEDLALAGIGIEKETDRNQEQVWNRVAPERYIFDMTAEDHELKDAEFMGEFWMRSGVDIYEEFQNLPPEKRLQIENASMTNVIGLHNIISFYANYAEKLPTYEMYWRDIEVTKQGAFYDEYGYPMLCEVSDKYPMENLIPVEELEVFKDSYAWIKTILNDGRKTITRNFKAIPTDQVRFCKFIPGEFVQGGSDIVLDYGIRPYSQKYSYRYDRLDFPYKVGTYSYILGEVMSPIDALISPQRFLNRVLSAAESRINNARGEGTIIDKDVIDPQDGEEGLLNKMNKSQPVIVNAGRQLNNAIGKYGSTIDNGTIGLFTIADNMKNIANDVFGGGQQIMGQGGAYRATGSVANMNLSQGVTMQEPFFQALARIYMQAYNSMVNRGKRIYTSNQRQLALEVGDEGVVIFQLSEEYDLEDFRSKVIRSADQYTERDSANQLLMTFLQMGMIDKKTFAANFNNSTVMDVAFALREFTGMQAQAEKQQQEVTNKQNEATAGQVIAARQLDSVDKEQDQATQFAINQDNNKTKIDAESLKAQSNIISSAIAARGREKSQVPAK